MKESVYKLIEVVGSSTESWEKAATAAIDQAATHLRDLRIAEVKEQDIHLEDGKPPVFRTRLLISFKYHGEG
ncbi:MAG TPA: dodecin family protein [Opitutaceae bacterium]